MQQLNAPSVRWEWISEAWNLFTKQWSVWVLMILVTYVIVFAIYLAVYIPLIGVIMTSATSATQMGEPVVFPTGIFGLYLIMWLAMAVAMSWLYGGLYSAAFKQLRGEQITVGALFSGGPYFARMFGALFLISIAAGIGSFLCFIPGLIVYGLAFLTFPMIVEGGKGTIEAIKASIDVTKRDWIMFTLFSVALVLIAIAGGFACGVGALATMPLLFLGHALAYRDLVGMPGAPVQGQFMPPPPPSDYRSYAPSQTPASQPQSQSWSEPTYVSPPQPPQPESTINSCPHCGATLTRMVNFCNQCGRPLRSS